MKNKDAIEILETMAMAESTFSDEESKKCCEAIDLAVQALKKEQAGFGTPLTLEQLREMDRNPVWVQNLEEPDKSQWRLCHWDRGKYLVLQGISVQGYLEEDYGKYWLAYAYPPSHIDRNDLCGEWQGEADGYADGNFVYEYWRCGNCGHLEEEDDIDLLPDFCPDCGLAMTEKARDILKKRLMG